MNWFLNIKKKIRFILTEYTINNTPECKPKAESVTHFILIN